MLVLGSGIVKKFKLWCKCEAMLGRLGGNVQIFNQWFPSVQNLGPWVRSKHLALMDAYMDPEEVSKRRSQDLLTMAC